jgi:hypothetical protein
MSFMFEVYYQSPVDMRKETALTSRVSTLGGRLSYREAADDRGNGSICLTYEFDDPKQAEIAAQTLREQGEHVEGPVDYGP